MVKVVLNAKDGYKLSLHIFEVSNPKGYVQVIHGMEEHQERYEKLICYLNDNGYTCVSSDLRGHGKDAPVLGYFAEKNGYEYLVNDQKIITDYIKSKYNVPKVNIFAHSMGTIITRVLLETDSANYDKVILSGHPCPNKASGFGIHLSRHIIRRKGTLHNSDFLKNASVGKYNKELANPKTDLDWLSVNEKNIENYKKDPYCGHGFTAGAYNDLFHLVKMMGNYKLYKDVNKDLEILMLRGSEDPCTGYEKGTKKSYDVLKKAGFEKITVHKYFNSRHEILNEDCYMNVFVDVKDFLNTGKIYNPFGI